MTTKTAAPTRYIQWIGTIDTEQDENKKPVKWTFKKKELKTTGPGIVITKEELTILNNGLINRPGAFHTIYLEKNEENLSWNPLELDPKIYQ